MGLVDYSDDESPNPSPLNNVTSKDAGKDVEPNQNPRLEKDPTYIDASSAQPSQLTSAASIENNKLPTSLVQPESQSIPPHYTQSKEADAHTPILETVIELKVQPKLTFEEIRTKRLQLLMPKAWPDCPSWELPPEPTTEVDPELQAKVAGLQAILERGVQFNQRLQANQSFRNPHIYDKLVEFLDLDEFGTNFPKSWYDPSAFPSAIRGSRLTEAQKAAARAKAAAQAANPRSNIPFVSAQTPSEIASSAIKRVMSSVETSAPVTQYPESRRRKTKWDMPPSAS